MIPDSSSCSSCNWVSDCRSENGPIFLRRFRCFSWFLPNVFFVFVFVFLGNVGAAQVKLGARYGDTPSRKTSKKLQSGLVMLEHKANQMLKKASQTLEHSSRGFSARKTGDRFVPNRVLSGNRQNELDFLQFFLLTLSFLTSYWID